MADASIQRDSNAESWDRIEVIVERGELRTRGPPGSRGERGRDRATDGFGCTRRSTRGWRTLLVVLVPGTRRSTRIGGSNPSAGYDAPLFLRTDDLLTRRTLRPDTDGAVGFLVLDEGPPGWNLLAALRAPAEHRPVPAHGRNEGRVWHPSLQNKSWPARK